MKKFDALLLSSGEGKRLRPLTNYIPKPLVQIQGEILLDIWIRKLIKIGVDKIYINVCYKKEQIITFIKNHPAKEKIIVIPEKKINGTLRTLLNLLKKKIIKDLLVIHSDNYTKKSLRDFIRFTQNCKSKNFGSMMIFKSNDHNTEGVVRYNKDLYLTRIYEKKKIKMGKYSNCAIYFFKKICLEFIIEKKFSKRNIDITTSLLPQLYNRIRVFKHRGYFLDIGNIEKLKKAQRLL